MAFKKNCCQRAGLYAALKIALSPPAQLLPIEMLRLNTSAQLAQSPLVLAVSF